MAFFAEMNRRQWPCVCGFYAITWYSNKLYNEWYESLTPEQKQILEDRKRKREEKNRRDIVRTFSFMLGVMGDLAMRSARRYDKYGGMYDAYGNLDEDFFKRLDESDVIDSDYEEIEEIINV